jgi:hypothetical protein
MTNLSSSAGFISDDVAVKQQVLFFGDVEGVNVYVLEEVNLTVRRVLPSTRRENDDDRTEDRQDEGGPFGIGEATRQCLEGLSAEAVAGTGSTASRNCMRRVARRSCRRISRQKPLLKNRVASSEVEPAIV